MVAADVDRHDARLASADEQVRGTGATPGGRFLPVPPPLVLYVAVLPVLLLVNWWVTARYTEAVPPSAAFAGSWFWDGWVRYDGGWYTMIAEHGYGYVPGHQSNVAFFPGYPLTMRAVGAVLDNIPLAGIVVTMACGATGLVAFHRWCRDRLTPAAALTAVACLALYPYAYYLYGAVYGDALFLLCALGAFLAFERDHLLLAGLAGAAATATRLVGVAVVVGLVVGVLERRRVVTGAAGEAPHLVAVGEDPPLLSAREVPTLVDRRGRLAPSWRVFLPRMAAGRVDPDDLRREFSAQIERLVAGGLRPGHVDTHQHLHLWPAVGEVVLDVARQAGIRAVRIIRSAARGPVGVTVRRLGRQLEGRAAGAGMRYPATATGLDEAGTLDLPRLLGAIDRLGATPAASAELATHPGEAHDPDRDRYRWGYLWDRELAGLTDPAARARVAAAGFRLGTYGDLVAS